MSKPAGGTKPLSRTPERFQRIQKTLSSSPTEHSAISKRNSEYINHFPTLCVSQSCKVCNVEVTFTVPQADGDNILQSNTSIVNRSLVFST